MGLERVIVFHTQRNISAGNLGEDCEDSVELRYVRYVNSEGDGIDGRLEYDMDEEDEEWLNQQGKQVSKGIQGTRLSTLPPFAIVLPIDNVPCSCMIVCLLGNEGRESSFNALAPCAGRLSCSEISDGGHI
jgi:hypothetical protein